MKTIQIVISYKTILFLVFILLVLVILYKSINVILLLTAAFIIAITLLPAVNWLDKKMPRGLAIFLVFIAGLIIITTIFIPVVFVLTNQIQQFITQMPSYITDLSEVTERWELSMQQYPILPDLNYFIQTLTNLSKTILKRSINLIFLLFQIFLGVFTLTTFILFILLDKDQLKEGFLSFFPADMHHKVTHITAAIANRVGGYVRGLFALMLLVGITTTIALYIVGLKFALAMGVLAGILIIIPIIGPVISAIPPILIALIQGPWWFPLIIITIYLGIQRIENTFTPYIQGKYLHMPPLVVMVAILIAGATLGIVGIILSPAIAAAIYVLIQELYLKNVDQEQSEQ